MVQKGKARPGHDCDCYIICPAIREDIPSQVSTSPCRDHVSIPDTATRFATSPILPNISFPSLGQKERQNNPQTPWLLSPLEPNLANARTAIGDLDHLGTYKG